MIDLIETGFVIDWNVKFSWELVDLLEVEGKLDKVIEEEDESFDWEKLLKPVDVITAFKKLDGTVKTMVSEKAKGLAILNANLPLKDDWTILLFNESKSADWNWMGVKSVTTLLHVSIFELSDAWLEMAILSDESITGGVNTDWTEKLNGDDKMLLVIPITVIYILLTGEPTTWYVHVKVPEVLAIDWQLGVVITVLLFSISLFHVNGNYNTIFPVDDIWFLGVKDTINLDLVKIVALWADILQDVKLPAVNVNLGKYILLVAEGLWSIIIPKESLI